MNDYYKKIDRYILKGRRDNDFSNTRKYALKIAWTSLKEVFSFKNIKIRRSKNIIRILAILDGGSGDAIFSIRFFFELKKKFEKIISLDFQVSKHMNLEGLLYGHDFFNKMIVKIDNSYDCVIGLARFPEIKYMNRDKIKRVSNDLMVFLEGIYKFQTENYMLYTNAPYHDFLGNVYAKTTGLKRENLTKAAANLDVNDSKFALFYDKKADEILSRYNLKKDNFITIQRGVGGWMKNSQKLTRLWSVENYNELVGLLKKQEKIKGIKIVQVGSKSSAFIENADIDLRGKTSFEELKALLYHAKLHIDGEGGMVHMRHFLCKKPSAVIFGPTSEEFFGYNENINISRRPSSCPFACEWLVPYWIETCLVTGTHDAVCQRNITPKMCVNKILSHNF